MCSDSGVWFVENNAVKKFLNSVRKKGMQLLYNNLKSVTFQIMRCSNLDQLLLIAQDNQCNIFVTMGCTSMLKTYDMLKKFSRNFRKFPVH